MVQTVVTSHLGNCRSLKTALPSGIRMVHPCLSAHANIICSERSSLATRISVVALTPQLCSLCPLFAIYIFITFWYIICFIYLFIYCLCLPSRRKAPWGWVFCPFIHCLKESLAQEVHRQYLWNEWQEERISTRSVGLGPGLDLNENSPKLFPCPSSCSTSQCLPRFSRVRSWICSCPRISKSVSIMYWGSCVQGPIDQTDLWIRDPNFHPGLSPLPLWFRCVRHSPIWPFFACTCLHFIDMLSGLGLLVLISR